MLGFSPFAKRITSNPSHIRSALSTRVMGIALIGAVATAGGAISAVQAKSTGADVSRFYGRWIVNDTGEKFSARGREYHTLDIAPCGNDFCGVAVSVKGTCGRTLFRFYRNARNAEGFLQGTTRWGQSRKAINIDQIDQEGAPRMMVFIGNGKDMASREGSMPFFDAQYTRAGNALCKAR